MSLPRVGTLASTTGWPDDTLMHCIQRSALSHVINLPCRMCLSASARQTALCSSAMRQNKHVWEPAFQIDSVHLSEFSRNVSTAQDPRTLSSTSPLHAGWTGPELSLCCLQCNPVSYQTSGSAMASRLGRPLAGILATELSKIFASSTLSLFEHPGV